MKGSKPMGRKGMHGENLGGIFARVTVGLAMALIVVGSLVTTHGAGMAFPDWPLSAASLNPEGWWGNSFQRLEHGHRLLAEGVAFCIGMLCSIVWRKYWAVPAAVAAAGIFSAAAWGMHLPREAVVHVGLWSAVGVFILVLFLAKPSAGPEGRGRERGILRWLAFGAFAGVVIQAVLGGLRVTLESAGDGGGAMVLRVLHGVFAQLEFCLLVAVAVGMKHPWGGGRPGEPAGGRTGRRGRAIGWVAWFIFGLLLLQLILGATMRHAGAGLIIPTFPQTTVEGGWLPLLDNGWGRGGGNGWVLLNFVHTRVMMILVGLSSFLFLCLAGRAGCGELRRWGGLLMALALLQASLGVLIIATGRGVEVTTFHVGVGAVLLAVSFVLALKSPPWLPGLGKPGIQPSPGAVEGLA